MKKYYMGTGHSETEEGVFYAMQEETENTITILDELGRGNRLEIPKNSNALIEISKADYDKILEAAERWEMADVRLVRSFQNKIFAEHLKEKPIETHVYLDAIDGEFKAYTWRNKHWNSWVCPYFEKEEADKLVAALNASGEMDAIFNPESNSYVIKPAEYESDDENETFEMTTIEVEGKKIETYAIGAFGWCWSEVHS